VDISKHVSEEDQIKAGTRKSKVFIIFKLRTTIYSSPFSSFDLFVDISREGV